MPMPASLQMKNGQLVIDPSLTIGIQGRSPDALLQHSIEIFLDNLRRETGMAPLDMKIVDDNGAELPWDGVAFGEIQCRGPWIASGYHNDADPGRITEDGWFRTGDVASMTPEGYIVIVDRTKDVIKSGGEWISSVELENTIMSHPKVLEAAVIGLPHSKWSERPVAYVVARPEFKGAITSAEIRDFLADKVARWWLPDDVRFADEIPKTSVGKFDKKVLRNSAEPIDEESTTAAGARSG